MRTASRVLMLVCACMVLLAAGGARSVTLRESPRGKVVGCMQAGTECQVVREQGAWVQVQITGWVEARNLEALKVRQAPEARRAANGMEPPEGWVEIWVPWVGSGAGDINPTLDDSIRPDIPQTPLSYKPGIDPPEMEGVDFTTCFGAVSDADPKSARAGKPLCKYACIWVKAKDVERCTKRILDEQVPDRDWKILRMHRECAADWDGRADVFFDSLGAWMTQEERELDRELLTQANLKGLSAVIAEAIRQRLDLGPMEFVNHKRGKK